MFNRLLRVGLLTLAVGCGKSPSPPTVAPEPSTPSAEAATTAPQAPDAGSEPQPPATTVDASQIPTLLAELTQVVRRYGAEQRRAPKTLDELVAQGYLTSIPEAPAGMKFAINARLEVILADR